MSSTEELNANGTATARYTQGLGIDEPLARTAAGATYFYQADGLGSITSLSSSTGTLPQTYKYDSFGNLTGSTGTVTNPFQYTARENDSETGLYYYRARYYDPSVGRFLSEDPIGFTASVNFYAYVQNNPTVLVDPLGLSWLVFDRPSSTLTLYANEGLPTEIITCTAKNNTDRRSNGPWPNGSNRFLSHHKHTIDPNGPYGSHGIFVFDVPRRPGMGVHSGRANRGGPAHPTMGCIRTDDSCMEQIWLWIQFDPLTDITVQ